MSDSETQAAQGGMKGSPGAAAPGTAPRFPRPRRRVLPFLRGGRSEIPQGKSAGAAVRRDALYRRALVVADVLAATFAGLVGVGLLGHDSPHLVLVLAIPAVLLIGKVLGLYDRDDNLIHKTTLDEAPQLFQVATLYALLVSIPRGQIFVEGELRAKQLIVLWALLFVSLILARSGARRLVRMRVSAERCLVLSDAATAALLQQKFAASHAVKAEILGWVPIEARPGSTEAPPVLGDVESLGVVLAEQDIERVIIAARTSDSDQILDLVRLVKSLGVGVTLLPRLFEVVGSSVEFDSVGGVTLLGLRRHGLSRSSQLLKRSMDVVGAALGLLLLGPLMLMIAIGIKLTSPGAVLFRQKRIGCRDACFEILKFRTMVVDADQRKGDLLSLNETHGLFKIADDPRITSFGRRLRRSALDELPQLLNVLKGEMSLVGPRPLVVDEDRRVEGWQRRRLQLRPGMTGLWQILGSAQVPLHEMVKIDYLYGANWSLWLDVKILLRTIPIVLNRRSL